MAPNMFLDIKRNIQDGKLVDVKNKDVVENLIKEGFLVSRHYNEEKIIEEIRKEFLDEPVFRILYLLLTDICNLKCRYCFVEGAMPLDHKFSLMDQKTAEKAIDIFAELLKKNSSRKKFKRPPNIIFYGGEPLLNESVFLAAMRKIEKVKDAGDLPEDISVILLTNATSISERVLRIVASKKVSVSVSLDGPKEIHDTNRVFQDGKGTFDTVLNNIQRLKKAGANLSISCTINSANTQYLEEVFRWINNSFQIKGLGFNLLLDLPGASQSDEDYVKKATRAMISCYELARQNGIYEDRMMRKVNAFVKKSLHLTDCGGYGNQIVVAPDGKIGPCHAYMGSGKFFVGHVDDRDFNPFTNPVFLEWSSRSPFNIPQCYFCEGIGLCGGGCAYNSDLKFNTIWKPDPNFCIHTKVVLEWLIWDLFSNIERR